MYRRATFCLLAGAATALFVSFGTVAMGQSETGFPGTAGASSRISEEVNAVLSYSDQEEWSGSPRMLPRSAIGFENFTTFSDSRGDFLFADLQARVVLDDRDESDSDWALEIHNAWLRWKLGLGRHLRVGHFSPAYGLEPVTDTHGTLLQTLAMEDIGFKHDWGVGYEGYVGPLDYRAAAQLGSGMGVDHDDGSYLLSARVGSPESEAVRWGASVLQGRTLVSADRRLVPAPRYGDDAVQRNRVGVDFRFPVGPFSSEMEASWGEDDSEDVLGGTVTFRLESLMQTRASVAVQGRYWSSDPGRREHSQGGVVVALPMSAESVVRVGYFEEVSTMDGDERDRMVVAQFYHLGL